MFELPSSIPSGLTHFQTAEKAKSHAWQHDHKKALALYREAMHQAQRDNADPIFLRHYTECVLESLEAMGQYQDVLSYCEEALSHYEVSPPETQLARFDVAAIHERRGINAAKSGNSDLAKESCEKACKLARELDQQLPVAKTLLQWLQRGLHISPERISTEQQRAGYFAVRSQQQSMTLNA